MPGPNERPTCRPFEFNERPGVLLGKYGIILDIASVQIFVLGNG